MTRRQIRVLVVTLAAWLAAPGPVWAGAGQGAGKGDVPAAGATARPGARPLRPGRAPVPPNPDVMTVQQVEQYFDQVVLHQARTTLRLTDDQFLRFGAGLGRLQTVRRQLQRRRMALVRDLNVLTNAAVLDEAAVAAKLGELDGETPRAHAEVRAAYAAIDQVLNVRQRARFRVFEETMERRKLELMSRARQLAGRRNAFPQPPVEPVP